MKVIYTTYQFFPDYRTNTFQTISTIKHLLKKGISVDLVFPDRKKGNLNQSLSEFYKLDQEFQIKKIKHIKNFSYKSNHILTKIIYVLNHLLFGYRSANYIKSKYNSNIICYTRSPYVLYFLRKSEIKVIYEVHQVTRISKFLIKNSTGKNTIYVPVSPYLKQILIKESVESKYIEYLETGYDEELFSLLDYSNKPHQRTIRFIYGGSMTINNISKGLEDLIFAFNKLLLLDMFGDLAFSIYCSNEEEYNYLKKFHKENKISNKVIIKNRIGSLKFYQELVNSDIGIIPLPNNFHTNEFSSSMKYFEYIRAGLVLMCSDVKANKRYPYPNSIFFENSQLHIEEAMKQSINLVKNKIDFDINKIKEFSFENRIDKIFLKLNTI